MGFQSFDVLLVKTFQRPQLQLTAQFFQPVKQRYGIVTQKELPRAPVFRIRTPFHQSCLFKTIDHTASGNRLDLQKFRKGALIDSGIPADGEQDPPLCARHPKVTRHFIKTASHEPRYVAQKITQSFFH